MAGWRRRTRRPEQSETGRRNSRAAGRTRHAVDGTVLEGRAADQSANYRRARSMKMWVRVVHRFLREPLPSMAC